MSYLSQSIQWMLESGLGLSTEAGIGEVLHFFLFASIEIFIMMTIMILGIGLLRSYINPIKMKKALAKAGPFFSHIIASLLGAVTPFCSCSSVPVFIGFIESGIPLGATFSFLITSPIVNGAALALLWAGFGWRIAAIYAFTGTLIGIVGGWMIEKLQLAHLVEERMQIQSKELEQFHFHSFRDRLIFAWNEVKSVISHVWKFVFIGIFIGSFIHGWTPEGLLVQYAGANNPFAVVIGVVVGIPVYASNMMMIPIIQTLIGKGMGVGTALAFMMAASALSLPEMIMLRKVLKAKLIKIFVFITGTSIIAVGYLFNALLAGV